MIKGSVKLEHVKGTDRDFLVSKGFWYLDKNFYVRVKKGWITDGASVPRLFWNIFPPVAGKYLEAAVLHDALYKSQRVKRSEADRLFYKAMKDLGVAFWKRLIIYLAVRIGGWLSWRENKKNLNPDIVFVRRKR